MKIWIQNNLLSNGKLISKKCVVNWFEKTHQLNLYNDIIASTCYINDATFPQRIWHIVNDVKIQPNCKNPNLTEWENMKINKWDRIWDCGSLKFELFIK